MQTTSQINALLFLHLNHQKKCHIIQSLVLQDQILDFLPIFCLFYALSMNQASFWHFILGHFCMAFNSIICLLVKFCISDSTGPPPATNRTLDYFLRRAPRLFIHVSRANRPGILGLSIRNFPRAFHFGRVRIPELLKSSYVRLINSSYINRFNLPVYSHLGK